LGTTDSIQETSEKSEVFCYPAKNTAKTAHYRLHPSPSAPLLAITLHPGCSTLRASPEPKIEPMIGAFPARHRATSELHRLQRPECRDLALPFGKDKSHAACVDHDLTES
jgi:hypothetical protein